MLHTGIASFLKAFGPEHKLAYVRWAPGATNAQTLTEAQGITAVTDANSGEFTITFSETCEAIIPIAVGFIDNTNTNYHEVRVVSTDAAAGTALVHHQIGTYADMTTTTLSVSCDELYAVFLLRVSK